MFNKRKLFILSTIPQIYCLYKSGTRKRNTYSCGTVLKENVNKIFYISSKSSQMVSKNNWNYTIAIFLCLCVWFPSIARSSTCFELIDLSHDLYEGGSYWDEKHPYTITIIENFTRKGSSEIYHTEEITLPVHRGTHFEAPCFVDKTQHCVSDIPLDQFVLPAVVVDIRHKVNDNPNVQLESADLKEWEEVNGHIPDGCLLLICTGWSKFWSDPLKYKGSDPMNLEYPTISTEAAEWISHNRKPYGIGMDSFSLESMDAGKVAHGQLMTQGIYALLNLKNLEKLPSIGCKAYVFPIKLRGAGGAPCRVVVKCKI